MMLNGAMSDGQWMTYLGKAIQWLAQEGVEAKKRIVELVIEARYDGQSFEIPVDVDASDLTADDFISRFHAAHKDVFGYALDSRAVTWRSTSEREP